MRFSELTPPPVLLAETTSTNDVAKTLARQGCLHGAAVVAEMQTAGRGRMGRSFLSPEGGVYLSVVFRPQGQAQNLRYLTLLFADAVCRAVFSVCGAACEIKWPNDVLLGGKKLAGILTEGVIAPSGAFNYLICGVGLNVAAVPEGVADIAASLADYAVDREALASEMIRELTAAASLSESEAAARLDRVRQTCATLGKTVSLHGENGTFSAFAEAIDENGALVIREKDGTKRKISSGEVLITQE